MSKISSFFNVVPVLVIFFFIFSQETRVRNVGGFVVMGRVMGKLAVSRAIGDSEFKRKNGRMMTEFNITGPLVIPDPDVTCTGEFFFCCSLLLFLFCLFFFSLLLLVFPSQPQGRGKSSHDFCVLFSHFELCFLLSIFLNNFFLLSLLFNSKNNNSFKHHTTHAAHNSFKHTCSNQT